MSYAAFPVSFTIPFTMCSSSVHHLFTITSYLFETFWDFPSPIGTFLAPLRTFRAFFGLSEPFLDFPGPFADFPGPHLDFPGPFADYSPDSF